ncbi:glycosyltransferase family 2 protein [Tuwongella immobilis]|uniref:Glycosyltransferase 2-like domain-containing protein n=1 Tax=Tuwongella immobilis TaxID=692036 RepID=A0A6C2YQD3_9BACT|nr:glycosyltransferase family 2 protein [Tuwongella immobilis]VIP03686.1 membrane protein containing glycosyl family 2 domain protein : Membrane protein containing Glycosyl transferase, family 2 domain protein OS=Rhodopirellula europaea 6C GN=RE6C_03760 PE=4 SV=1: Glycos_transf_2 [Tuwongella immobilis]VTS04740.1 membrane protein containing glycosyl family 2 domain protein : Membrane protein containing Glycosyl transferase, family 2 domain protein OS=Rhodopirellula europaea 6C GN=RE6C_03760 PE=4 S
MNATSRWQVSLVMPAYNEEAGIAVSVREAHAAISQYCDNFEILVVDDGSRDATAATVLDLADDLPEVRLIQLPGNQGYGAALRTGFEAALFDRVAFTDADAQFDLADLGRLLSLSNQAPIVVGYRVDRQDPWRRRFFSWGYNRLIRLLLGTHVRDVDCALKVFDRNTLMRILPQARNFFVNTEMLSMAQKLGIRVLESGVRHRHRRHGTSKVSLSDIPKTLAKLLPFWYRERICPYFSLSSPSIPR